MVSKSIFYINLWFYITNYAFVLGPNGRDGFPGAKGEPGIPGEGLPGMKGEPGFPGREGEELEHLFLYFFLAFCQMIEIKSDMKT